VEWRHLHDMMEEGEQLEGHPRMDEEGGDVLADDTENKVGHCSKYLLGGRCKEARGTKEVL